MKNSERYEATRPISFELLRDESIFGVHHLLNIAQELLSSKEDPNDISLDFFNESEIGTLLESKMITPKQMYKIGDVFFNETDGEYYILAQTMSRKFVLIALSDGNRLSDSISGEPNTGISLKELNTLANGDKMWPMNNFKAFKQLFKQYKE